MPQTLRSGMPNHRPACKFLDKIAQHCEMSGFSII
nr:MAG TPA: hypothetical protein [Caudoviricetes sp.]DAT57797.1 MAG TPA: hypothetical protein [Caudoviricetes sp.]DAY13094.1 MAG TPA: hypothetical protein [Caudoviricetes sp.]